MCKIGADTAPVGVDVRGLRKTFFPGTVQEKLALDGVDFSLDPSEFAIVIGSNGAGKSTTLNAISGEILTDSGSISIGQNSLEGLPTHRRARYISRVFQDPMQGTAASLTIEENLAISLRRGKKRSLRPGLNASERNTFQTALEALGLGLENRLKDRVSLLSGGQRQSLTLIMATLKPPQLLLLDEHTAALDPRAAELVIKATLDVIKKRQITTLMITHNMEQAITYGDRLLMMHEGRIILDLNKAEKAKLTTADLVDRFHDLVSDRMMLN